MEPIQSLSRTVWETGAESLRVQMVRGGLTVLPKDDVSDWCPDGNEQRKQSGVIVGASGKEKKFF